MKNKEIIKYDIESVSKEVGVSDIGGIAISGADDGVRKKFTDHPHIVDGVVIALCMGGSARLKVNFQEYTLKKGAILIVLPNSMMDPIEVSDDLQIRTIVFSFDFVDTLSISSDFEILSRVRNMSCIELSDELFRTFADYHAFISAQYLRENLPYKYEVLKYILLALISEIKALYSIVEETCGGATRMEQVAKEFFNLLYKHYKDERNIAFYADKLHLTPKYLTTAIRQQTGKSILVWINEGLILNAKSLLKSTNMTVQEIAFELNFSDSSLFCRFFKRYTEMTPSGYRSRG